MPTARKKKTTIDKLGPAITEEAFKWANDPEQMKVLVKAQRLMAARKSKFGVSPQLKIENVRKQLLSYRASEMEQIAILDETITLIEKSKVFQKLSKAAHKISQEEGLKWE